MTSLRYSSTPIDPSAFAGRPAVKGTFLLSSSLTSIEVPTEEISTG
jgi:hypothetical protein